MIPVSLLAAVVLGAAAPISTVTVFNDRARVVREGTLELHGVQDVELALLPDAVDPATVRVELSGARAEVQRVELLHVDSDAFAEEPARRLLEQLEALDDRLTIAARQQSLLRAQLQSLQQLTPLAPAPDQRGRTPKANASGWALVLSFLDSGTERLQGRVRDSQVQLEELQRQRQTLAERANELGATHRQTGLRVRARVSGEGSAHATLTYSMLGARWSPRWELSYRPGDETVRARLDALVTQSTGESWSSAALTFSTAVPGALTQVPELLSWRIGEKERFTPVSRPTAVPQPPRFHFGAAPSPQPDAALANKQQLREQLLALAARQGAAAQQEKEERESGQGAAAQFASGSGDDSLAQSEGKEMAMPPPAPEAPAMAAAPMAQAKSSAVRGRRSATFDAAQPTAASGSDDKPLAPAVGIAPPPSWSLPPLPADSPLALAGGYDLAFAAETKATLESGSGARRIPLFSATWPVQVEHILYPALQQQAWLVAKLRVPGSRALPGGQAELLVAGDPSGDAHLSFMEPGEELTLPLGVDHSIRPIRNVDQVQSQKGLFSKDDVDEYVVTIEVANPYPHPIALRVFDQLPRKGDQNVEVELRRTQPQITPDKDSGKLEWALTVPAGQKTQLQFAYALSRSHGARLHQ